MMASLGWASRELRRRVTLKFLKLLFTPRERMPSVNGFLEVCDESVSTTCSSCMRSNSTAYLPPTFSTSIESGHIKASSSKSQSQKLAQYQQIAQVARLPHSRSWVGFIMTIAEVHEIFQR